PSVVHFNASASGWTRGVSRSLQAAVVVLLEPRLVLPRLHVLPPRGVRDVPRERAREALGEAERRLPAQLALQLRRVDRVPPVVAGSVFDESNETEDVCRGPTRLFGHQLAERPDDVDVGALLVAADVVGVTDLSALDDRPDGLAVVVDVEPIAAVAAGAVHGQLSALEGVEERERNELLRGLPRAVVVRAVRDRDGKTVRPVKLADEVIGRRLRRRIRAARIVAAILG